MSLPQTLAVLPHPSTLTRFGLLHVTHFPLLDYWQAGLSPEKDPKWRQASATVGGAIVDLNQLRQVRFPAAMLNGGQLIQQPESHLIPAFACPISLGTVQGRPHFGTPIHTQQLSEDLGLKHWPLA